MVQRMVDPCPRRPHPLGGRAYVAARLAAAVEMFFAHDLDECRFATGEALRDLLEEALAAPDRRAFSLACQRFLAGLENGHTEFRDERLEEGAAGRPAGLPCPPVRRPVAGYPECGRRAAPRRRAGRNRRCRYQCLHRGAAPLCERLAPRKRGGGAVLQVPPLPGAVHGPHRGRTGGAGRPRGAPGRPSLRRLVPGAHGAHGGRRRPISGSRASRARGTPRSWRRWTPAACSSAS